MSAIIYLLTNTINGKQYIGQTTVGLEQRWKKHCDKANHGCVYHLHNAIRKYGPEVFIKEILEETTIEQINDREIYWIAKMKTKKYGYNMTDGGEGTRGVTLNEKTRAKMSKAKSGKNHPFYGKKFSPEYCNKLSASRTGIKNWQFNKKGKNHPNYGKKHTEETRQKISQSMKLHKRMKRIFAPAIIIRITPPKIDV